jgi:magnesium-transporting ATPase (P-type)
MPVLALAVFDQDVNDFYSVKYPKLYTPGIKNMLFNKAEFFKSVKLGIVTSAVLFFVTYGKRGKTRILSIIYSLADLMICQGRITTRWHLKAM